MAVSASTGFSGPYPANGSTKVFPFTFAVLATDQVSVVSRVSGVDSVVSPASYTVSLSGAAPSAGSVTFGTAPASGQIFVLLNPPFASDAAFENGSAWLAKPVNDGYDASALRDMALRRDMARSMLAPVGETMGALPSAASRAGKVLAFEVGTGAPVAGPDFGGLGTISAALTAIGTVSASIASVNTVAAAAAAVETAASNIAAINTAATNIAAIITAPANAATATTQAGYAQANANAASASASAAAASAASALNAPGTSATSTTSLTIGTGSKSLTLAQTDKAFALGQFVTIASTASPTNYMIGQITAFTASTGAMTVTVSQTGGSGTISAWTVSLSAIGGVTSSSTDTLSNKTIDLASNTLTGTAAQFNAALSGADFALAGWTQIAQLATTSGTSQTFTSIPQTYADLLVVPACSHNSGASESLRMDISDDNGSNWSGSFSTWGQAAADTIRGQIFIPGYRVGTGIIMGSCPALATNRTLNMRNSVSSGAFGLADWRADAGINALRFTNSGGAAFDAGTITLYGR